MSGTNPKGGYLEYENNKIIDGCLTIDDYKATIENGEVTTVEKGSCPDMSPTSCSVESSPESWFKFDDRSNPGKITDLQLKDDEHPNGYNGEDIIKIPCYRSDGIKITSIGWSALHDIVLKELVFPDTFETIQEGPLNNVTIDKVIFGKSIKVLSGSNFGSSKLGKVIFLGTPEDVRDGTFQDSTIDELILGESVDAFYHYVFYNIKSIKTIYNSENKVLDWNYLLTRNSSEPFNYGVVKKNDIDTVIKSDDNNLKKVDKQIFKVVDNVKYYNPEWIGQNPVYFNPIDYIKCIEGTQNCMKWYSYSEYEKDGKTYVNMILDHNTTAEVSWITKEHYGTGITELATNLGITYPNGNIVGVDDYGSSGNWNKGPITLLNQLKIDTDGWSSELVRNDFYIEKNNYSSEEVIERYTINYNGYKARLITLQEIDIFMNRWYLRHDSLWLSDNLFIPSTGGSAGYWTVSSTSGYLSVQYVYIGSHQSSYVREQQGVRPVITVLKDKIQ